MKALTVLCLTIVLSSANAFATTEDSVNVRVGSMMSRVDVEQMVKSNLIDGQKVRLISEAKLSDIQKDPKTLQKLAMDINPGAIILCTAVACMFVALVKSSIDLNKK